jgi:hypothetical protein
MEDKEIDRQTRCKTRFHARPQAQLRYGVTFFSFQSRVVIKCMQIKAFTSRKGKPHPLAILDEGVSHLTLSLVLQGRLSSQE